MSINNVTVVGNVVRDPEPIWTQNGTCVCEFSVAVNESKKNADGTFSEVVSFFDVVTFAKRAEFLGENLRKGMKVTVSGRLQQQTWQNRQGENRSKVRIVADNVELPPKPKNEPYQGASMGAYGVAEQFGGTVTLPEGDNLPF